MIIRIKDNWQDFGYNFQKDEILKAFFIENESERKLNLVYAVNKNKDLVIFRNNKHMYEFVKCPFKNGDKIICTKDFSVSSIPNNIRLGNIFYVTNVNEDFFTIESVKDKYLVYNLSIEDSDNFEEMDKIRISENLKQTEESFQQSDDLYEQMKNKIPSVGDVYRCVKGIEGNKSIFIGDLYLVIEEGYVYTSILKFPLDSNDDVYTLTVDQVNDNFEFVKHLEEYEYENYNPEVGDSIQCVKSFRSGRIEFNSDFISSTFDIINIEGDDVLIMSSYESDENFRNSSIFHLKLKDIRDNFTFLCHNEINERCKEDSESKKDNDKVNHPSHYTWLKDECGIEVIDITRHLDFDKGNAVKYLLRSGYKAEEGYSKIQKEIEDLKKAKWYIDDKIKQLEKMK